MQSYEMKPDMGKILSFRGSLAVIIIVAIYVAARYLFQLIDLSIFRDALGVQLPEQGTLIIGLTIAGAFGTIIWSFLKITPYLGVKWIISPTGISVVKGGQIGTGTSGEIQFTNIVRVTYESDSLGELFKYSTVKAELTNTSMDHINIEYVTSAKNYVMYIQNMVNQAKNPDLQPTFEDKIGGVMDRM